MHTESIIYLRYEGFTFLEMPDTGSTRRLLEAWKTGDLKSIKYLLEPGDPSQLVKYAHESSHHTSNDLHFTCMLGQLDALKILFDYCESHRFETSGVTSGG